MRIYEYINVGEGVFTSQDFTIVCNPSLMDVSTYDKGRKVDTIYNGVNFLGESEKVVSKTFTDIIENNLFKGVNIVIEWYDKNGIAKAQKKITKLMGKGVAFDYLRKRRQRSISYLQVSSIGTPIEGYVLTMLKHYKDEVDLFIQGNSTDFETAVNTEANTTILSMLDMVIDGDIKTVKDSILYQIT